MLNPLFVKERNYIVWEHKLRSTLKQNGCESLEFLYYLTKESLNIFYRSDILTIMAALTCENGSLLVA